MNSANAFEELDLGITALLAGADRDAEAGDLKQLLDVADDLRYLPRKEFKTQLLSELEAEMFKTSSVRLPRVPRDEMILPSLFGAGANAYPVNRGSFVASYLGQAAMLALIATSGFWMVQHRVEIQKQLTSAIEIAPYTLPPSPDESGGGGGGGDRDKMAASKGALPKMSREQITPPAIVVRNDNSRLVVPPSVVMPKLDLPQLGALGDPMSKVLGPVSNGTGSGGGIGSGSGGGIGSGTGPGVGPGSGGGIGGGVYRIGGGVSAPVAIYDPDPEYSEEARKQKYQGTVILWVIIDNNGHVRDMKVQRSLGMGLDEKAMEAVKKWRFRPAMKDGKPVAVQVNVEVNFRLF